MKKITTVLAALAILATGCSTQAASSTTTLNAPVAAAAPSGHVGSTLTVRTSGTVLAITLNSQVDPATARPALTPGPGSRLVGFQFTFGNQGPAAFSDPKLPGLAAFDAAGNRLVVHTDRGVTADVLNGGVQGMGLPYVQLKKIGWVVVEVPSGDRIAVVKYTAPGAVTMSWGL